MCPRSFAQFGCGLAAILPLLFCQCASAAEPRKPKLQDMMPDLMEMQQESDSICEILWLPTEFWGASASQNPRVTSEQVNALLKAIRPYTVFAVAEGTIGPFGTMSFKSEPELRKNIKLADAKGTAYEPLGEDDIPGELKVTLGAFKPALANVAGAIGKNMQVFVFRDSGPDGARLFDPKTKGSVVVKLGARKFKWRLPLGSVVPPKQCAKCKEQRSGAWDFCPWCGAKLSPIASK